MKSALLLIAAVLTTSILSRAGTVCAVPDTLQLACIYTNFGAEQTFQSGSGLTPALSAVGVSFVPNASYLLMDLEVAAYRANSEIPDSVQFSIYDSVGGFPGSALETFSLTGLGVAGNEASLGTITAASVLHPLLTGGAQYWLVMSGVNAGDVTWNFNSTGRIGAATQVRDSADDPLYWITLSEHAQGAFALDGDPSVPEPGTWLLSAPLLAGVWLRKKRRNP